MTKKDALKVVNKMLSAKKLMEEAKEIIYHCTDAGFCLNIMEFEDFENLCKALKVNYWKDDCFYNADYNELKIVCIVSR